MVLLLCIAIIAQYCWKLRCEIANLKDGNGLQDDILYLLKDQRSRIDVLSKQIEDLKKCENIQDTGIVMPKLIDITDLEMGTMNGTDENMQNEIKQYIEESDSITTLKANVEKKYGGDWQIYIVHSLHDLSSKTFVNYSLDFHWRDWSINIWRTRLQERRGYSRSRSPLKRIKSVTLGSWCCGSSNAMANTIEEYIISSNASEDLAERLMCRYGGYWHVLITTQYGPLDYTYSGLTEFRFYSNEWIIEIWNTNPIDIDEGIEEYNGSVPILAKIQDISNLEDENLKTKNEIQQLIQSSESATELTTALCQKYGGDWHVFIGYEWEYKWVNISIEDHVVEAFGFHSSGWHILVWKSQ